MCMLIGCSDLHSNIPRPLSSSRIEGSMYLFFKYLTVIALIAVCLIPVFDRGPSVTIAGPMPSLLDRRSMRGM